MINAYFDDSGTHVSSDVVLVAGVMGTEWQIRSLEAAWQQHLQNPLEGRKAPLTRFHMFDCQASMGEFVGWTRTESNYFTHLLQRAMIDAHVAIYGVACQRADWDELIVGNLKPSLGTAEGQCIRNCFLKALAWARNCTFDTEMSFTFDKRPSLVQRDAAVVFDAFRRHSITPKLVACNFASSKVCLPLQAADLVAWELYQHIKDLQTGDDDSLPKRTPFRRLTSSTTHHFQLATRASIERIRDFWQQQDPENLASLAQHFLTFNPDNPSDEIQ